MARYIPAVPAATLSQLQALLDSTPFTRAAGLRVESIGEGECTLAVAYDPAADRPDGRVNGARYMLAADVGVWLAIQTLAGTSAAAVTIDMTTAFLSSARAEPFTCRSRVLKLGQRVIYAEAECVAGGRLLTRHGLTYARRA